MKKAKKVEAEILAARQKCYYRVDIDMNVFEDSSRHFEQSTTFKGSDLLNCRERAVDYYRTIYGHLQDADTFCGLPFAGYKDSIPGKTAVHTVVLFFINEHGEEHAMLGWDKEDSIDAIGTEFFTLLDLDFQCEQIPVLSDRNISCGEVKAVYAEIMQARTK